MNFENMSVEDIRKRMSELGWFSDDRLSDIGWGAKIGYSIWFFRWDWHGVKLGTRVSSGEATSDLTKIRDVTIKAAQNALIIWEKFPNKIPNRLVNGEFVAELEFLQPAEFKGE